MKSFAIPLRSLVDAVREGGGVGGGGTDISTGRIAYHYFEVLSVKRKPFYLFSSLFAKLATER